MPLCGSLARCTLNIVTFGKRLFGSHVRFVTRNGNNNAFVPPTPKREEVGNAPRTFTDKLVKNCASAVEILTVAFINMALLDGYQRKRLIQLWEEENHQDDNYVYSNVAKRAKQEGITATRQAVRYLIKKFKEGGTVETRQAKYRLIFGESANSVDKQSPTQPEDNDSSPGGTDSTRKELFRPQMSANVSPGDATATVILATRLDLLQSDVASLKVDLLGLKETVRDLQTKFNTMVAKLTLAQSLQAAAELPKDTMHPVVSEAMEIHPQSEVSIVDQLQQAEGEVLTVDQHQTVVSSEAPAHTIEATSEEPVNEVQLTTSGREGGGEAFSSQQFSTDAAAVLAGLHSMTSLTTPLPGQPIVSNIESVVTSETTNKFAIPREVLEVALDECRSRTSLSTSLVRLLFTPEERLTSNCRGVGKNQLDPQRIQAVMDTCMAVFPPQADETPKSVRAKIRTAVDSSNRALRIKHRRSMEPMQMHEVIPQDATEEVVEVHEQTETVVDNTGQTHELHFQLPVSTQ